MDRFSQCDAAALIDALIEAASASAPQGLKAPSDWQGLLRAHESFAYPVSPCLQDVADEPCRPYFFDALSAALPDDAGAAGLLRHFLYRIGASIQTWQGRRVSTRRAWLRWDLGVPSAIGACVARDGQMAA